MCVVCIEKAKGTITSKEAMGALREMVQTAPDNVGEDELNHFFEIEEDIKKELADQDDVKAQK